MHIKLAVSNDVSIKLYYISNIMNERQFIFYGNTLKTMCGIFHLNYFKSVDPFCGTFFNDFFHIHYFFNICYVTKHFLNITV